MANNIVLEEDKLQRDEKNIQILLSGWWYSELPPVLDFSILKDNICSVIQEIENDKYKCYKKLDENSLVSDFKNIAVPDYKTSSGKTGGEWTEPILYFAFKKKKSYREMQIPNMVQYLAFVYNTVKVFDDIYMKLYLDCQFSKYVENSNSYVVIGEYFTINNEYEDIEEIEQGIFVSNNNKQTSNVTFSVNQQRYNLQQKAYLYSTKIDIESFFPNVYTHNFEKMFKTLPFSSLGIDDSYFVFLDKFHQRINNNQTKGIPAGLFSSHIAAELLMISVDEEIRNYIKDMEMGYIRYVDDMTFFSDDLNELDKIYSVVQKILNKYRLRINGVKTEQKKNIEKVYSSTDIEEIHGLFPCLKEENKITFNDNDFKRLKIYILEQLKKDNISQIKSILTKVKKAVSRDFCIIEQEVIESIFNYLVMLIFEEENLAYHIYQILEEIIVKSAIKEKYIDILRKKQKLIDEKFSDTIIQIWNYYIITKYVDDKELDALWEISKDNVLNPIIVSCFVKKGKGKNGELFRWIKECYKKEIKNETSWKNSIMFSKWWLPIAKIKQYDKKNYCGFMKSENFPEVLKDLIEEQKLPF